MKTVLICGGRDFGDLTNLMPEEQYQKVTKEYDFIWERLDALLNQYRDALTIVEGGALGVDTAAAEWALAGGIPIKEYRAEWEKYGKRAGPIRNSKMLEYGKPDLVIAFPGGPGTKNMVELSKKAGVEVWEVEYRGN